MASEAQKDLQLTIAAKVFQRLYKTSWQAVSVAYSVGDQGERVWFRPRDSEGRTVHTAPPADLAADFAELRRIMAGGEHAWHAVELTLARDGVMSYDFTHDPEVEWGTDGPPRR